MVSQLFLVFCYTLTPAMSIGSRYTRHKPRGQLYGTQVSVHMDATIWSCWAVRFTRDRYSLG